VPRNARRTRRWIGPLFKDGREGRRRGDRLLVFGISTAVRLISLFAVRPDAADFDCIALAHVSYPPAAVLAFETIATTAAVAPSR
jgi:hypothetical protein